MRHSGRDDRSAVGGLSPLADPENYCVEDCNYLLDYYRLTGDNRLLYGGGVVYGARDPDDVERLIMPKLLKTFPQLQGEN